MSFFKKKPLVDWTFSCGRAFLMVNGCAIVMEGDTLRDPDLAEIGEKQLLEKFGPKATNGYGEMTNQAVLRSYRLDEGGLKVWTEDLIKHVAKEANGGVLPE